MHVQRASLYDSRGLAYRWLDLHVHRIAADRDWAQRPPREVGRPPSLEELEVIHLGMRQLTLAELTSELRSVGFLEFALLMTEILSLSRFEEQQAANRQRAEWIAWAQEAVLRGGKAAHRFSRPPPPIPQSPVQHGVPLMGREALQHVQNTWMQIWSEHREAQLPDASRLPDLPEITLDNVQTVCARYRKGRARGVDGLSVRSWAWLPANLLTRLLDMVRLFEQGGQLSSEMCHLITMLPKPQGGYRPVALTCSFLRFWGRARLPIMMAWDRERTLRGFWGGKGRSCSLAAWIHSAAGEAARARGEHSASLFLDLARFFEHVRHTDLWSSAVSCDVPLKLVRLAATLYSLDRAILWQGMLTRPQAVAGTILPGCSLAMPLIKALMYPLILHLQNEFPAVLPTSLVDDLSLTAWGRRVDVQAQLIEAGHYTVAWLAARSLPLSPGKCAVMASNVHLQSAVVRDFADSGFVPVESVKHLGVEASCKGRRR
eukprot:5691342-Amphidinium_carterae.1